MSQSSSSGAPRRPTWRVVCVGAAPSAPRDGKRSPGGTASTHAQTQSEAAAATDSSGWDTRRMRRSWPLATPSAATNSSSRHRGGGLLQRGDEVRRRARVGGIRAAAATPARTRATTAPAASTAASQDASGSSEGAPPSDPTPRTSTRTRRPRPAPPRARAAVRRARGATTTYQVRFCRRKCRLHAV